MIILLKIVNLEVSSKELSINNFIFTIVISTVSQLGDIIISYFKEGLKLKIQVKLFEPQVYLIELMVCCLLFPQHLYYLNFYNMIKKFQFLDHRLYRIINVYIIDKKGKILINLLSANKNYHLILNQIRNIIKNFCNYK